MTAEGFRRRRTHSQPVEKVKRVEAEKQPKVTVDILFLGHIGSEDHTEIPELMARADVVVFESVFWREESLEDMRSVSMGRRTAEDVLDEYRNHPEDQRATELPALFNTKKPLYFADVSADHPERARMKLLREKVSEKQGEATHWFSQGKLDDAIRALKAYSYYWLQYDTLREDIMIDVVKNLPQQLAEEHPELSKKEEIKIFWTLGYYHSRVMHELQKHFEVNRHSPQSSQGTHVMLRLDEMNRRGKFSKPEFNKEEYSRTLLEMFLFWYIRQNIPEVKSFERTDKVIRQIADQFSIDEIEVIGKEMKDFKDRNPSYRNYPDAIFAKVMGKFGVTLPKSQDEIDTMLAEKEFRDKTTIKPFKKKVSEDVVWN